MKTSRHDLIKSRLAKFRSTLDQIIDRLTPEMMEWAPSNGMRTVGGQLAEIACCEIPLVPRLKEGKDISDAEVDDLIGDSTSLDNLKRVLISVRKDTLDYLDSLSEAELEENVPYLGAWFGSFWLPEMPRAELFLNIADHEHYHIGQLTSYLWFRGDDPYKW